MSTRWSHFAVPAQAAALALLLAAGLAAGLGCPSGARAEEKKQSVSPDVVKKLKPAQDAIAKDDFDTGIPLAREALALSTKPYDKEMSLRILMYALGKKQDYAGYAEAVQQLLTLEAVQGEERAKYYKQLAQIYAQQKDYAHSTEYAAKWAEGGGGFDAYTLLASIYLVQKDCKNGVAALEKAVEVAGRPANEEELKRENYCYYQLGDKAKRQVANEALVARFLKRDYLIDLLHIYIDQNIDSRAILHIYRFAFDHDFLTRETEYVDFGSSVLDVGSPVEAETIVQKGASSGAIQFTAPTDRNSRLRAHAKQQAAEDRKLIAQLDKEARSGKNGEADVKVGLVYLGLGENAKAVEAIQRGLDPERLAKVKRVDDAHMMLGIAFARLGKKEEATAAFNAAKADPRMEKAATIWLSAL